MNPLCVDLDGTLIRDDVTFISIKELCKRNILNIVLVISWFFRGIAFFKMRLAEAVNVNPDKLHFNTKLLEYIYQEKKCGRKIYLATACAAKYANEIANYLECFDGVFSSNDTLNLRARNKADKLCDVFGYKLFDYAGNSMDDIHVWDVCNNAIVVNPNFFVLKKMKNKCYLLFK